MAASCNNASPAIQTSQPNIPMQPQIKEFSIRLAKNNCKKHSVMRFNKELNVEFKAWAHAKLERETNMKENINFAEEMPKFGAGSEFGRDAREEARKRKFGFKSKKYNADNQPWILKTAGEKPKKFKGVREGGISANAAYYVFKQSQDGSIVAYPLYEWYNFQPIQRYKALSAEEAEEEFLRRDKTLNYFNVMMRKRLRIDEDDNGEAQLLDGDQESKKKGKELKISEMDEWIDTDEEDGDEDEDGKKKSDDEDCDKKKKNVKKKKIKKKVSNEAFEESDDGDEEGRECDYISDSSASEDELEVQKQIKSVDEERGLRKLLVSDEEDEDEDEEEKEDEEKDDENKEGDAKDNKQKDNKQKKDVDSDSSSSSKSGTKKEEIKQQILNKKTGSLKRSHNISLNVPEPKKTKLGKDQVSATLPSTSSIPGAIESGITEAAVRRYLLRKPMTVTDLLLKFKSKKTGLDSEQIGVILTEILMKMNPSRQVINGKMHYFIKS